jgi:predicted ATP-dependent endonuclease of OLD family
MQKIIIKNFGAIKEAEIDIPKTLVLIGEQASGKSTIAKLIYFFQELRDDFFEFAILSDKNNHMNLWQVIVVKFQIFFGDEEQFSDFEVTYFYELEKQNYIKIFLSQEKKITGDFSDYFKNSVSKAGLAIAKNNIMIFNQFIDSAEDSKEIAVNKNQRDNFIKAVGIKVNEMFNIWYENILFIISGRNATVQYNDLFVKHLFTYVQNQIKENKNSIEDKEQTVNEYLTMQFMERVSRVKTVFERNGGTFASLLKSENKNVRFQKAENKISEILKGKYSSDKSGEKIHLENGGFVRLSNASSGQQESIRILQDLFLVILQNQKVLRIVEEPEAHLFPIAQKQMVELLALMVNQNKENSLIVTTHSPYILSTFNNLLFASRVIEKNPNAENEVSEIVDIDFRLKAADFAAYTLINTEGGFVSESIMSDRGVIKQNYLDTASEMLSYEFNNLQLIHAKTFARK